MSFKAVNIRKFMNISGGNEFFECHLRESLDIHGAAAGEEGECLDLLGRAVGIGADQHFRVDLPADFGLSSAYRTLTWNLQSSGSGQILRNLGNDHICLVDSQPVPDPQLKSTDNTDIVHGSAAYSRPLQFNRLKNRHGIDQACAAGAPLHLRQSRLLLLIGPFKRYGIAGKLGRCPQGFSIGNIVKQKDQTVRRNIVSRAFLLKVSHGLCNRLSCHKDRLDSLKALFFEKTQLLQSGVMKVRAGAFRSAFLQGSLHQRKSVKTNPPAGRHCAVQLAHRAAAEIAGIFVSDILDHSSGSCLLGYLFIDLLKI